MKNKKTVIVSILAVVFVVAMFLLLVEFGSSNTSVKNSEVTNSDPLGMQITAAPWNNGNYKLRERLDSIGLPALSSEGTVLHIHQHLDIFIHGQQVDVPADIGVDSFFISPIHTHDTSAVIHVESPVIQDFTLGQFFDIWGVPFSSSTLGIYTTDSKNSITVFVNGKKISGDPRSIVLEAHQEIVVAYGNESELPNPIPNSYDFPQGE